MSRPVQVKGRRGMRLQSGDTLRALIAQRGLNQSRLAGHVECSPSFINALCVGAKTSCSRRLALRISEVLEVPAAVLFTPTQSPSMGCSIPEEEVA